MPALTSDRNTPLRGDQVSPRGRRVAANATIYAGAIVAFNSAGFAVPAAAVAAHRIDGRAEEQVRGGPTDGAATVLVRPGVFRFDNATGADAVVQADLLNECFVVDDNTVARTNGGGTRPVAGRIIDIDPQGVWVRLGFR